jgi:hypothetical protein
VDGRLDNAAANWNTYSTSTITSVLNTVGNSGNYLGQSFDYETSGSRWIGRLKNVLFYDYVITNTYTLANFRSLPAISKDEIAKIQFEEMDVLSRPEDIRVRRTNLDKAIALGRSEKIKTSIILKAGDNLYRLETNVVSIQADSMTSSNGLNIPLRCIYSVDFMHV